MLTEKEKQLQQQILRDPDSLESLDIIQDYKLGDNIDFMLPILKEAPYVVYLFPKMLKNKQLVYQAIKQKPSIYPDLEPELKEDADIALRFLMSSKGSLSLVRHLSPKLLNNPNFINRALKIDKDILGTPSAVYKLGGLVIHTLSRMNKADAFYLKNSLMKTTMAIKNSLVPGFSKVLQEVVIRAGWKQDFESKLVPEDDSIKAYYRIKQSDIIFFFDETGMGENDFVDMIHELSHKFHHLYIKDGFNNQDIKNLYDVATNSEAECKRVSFPKIGDPLSNLLNYDSQYEMPYLVKTATPEVYFVGVFEEEGEDYFVYEAKENVGNQIFIPKEKILKMIRCPSRYSAEDAKEFFAEMCVAITINKVRPEQRQWANHFINIVKKNLK
jgi:hypothetical protein